MLDDSWKANGHLIQLDSAVVSGFHPEIPTFIANSRSIQFRGGVGLLSPSDDTIYDLPRLTELSIQSATDWGMHRRLCNLHVPALTRLVLIGVTMPDHEDGDPPVLGHGSIALESLTSLEIEADDLSTLVSVFQYWSLPMVKDVRMSYTLPWAGLWFSASHFEDGLRTFVSIDLCIVHCTSRCAKHPTDDILH